MDNGREREREGRRAALRKRLLFEAPSLFFLFFIYFGRGYSITRIYLLRVFLSIDTTKVVSLGKFGYPRKFKLKV